jgi:hypothetical protein
MFVVTLLFAGEPVDPNAGSNEREHWMLFDNAQLHCHMKQTEDIPDRDLSHWAVGGEPAQVGGSPRAMVSCSRIRGKSSKVQTSLGCES